MNLHVVEEDLFENFKKQQAFYEELLWSAIEIEKNGCYCGGLDDGPNHYRYCSFYIVEGTIEEAKKLGLIK